VLASLKHWWKQNDILSRGFCASDFKTENLVKHGGGDVVDEIKTAIHIHIWAIVGLWPEKSKDTTYVFLPKTRKTRTTWRMTINFDHPSASQPKLHLVKYDWPELVNTKKGTFKGSKWTQTKSSRYKALSSNKPQIMLGWTHNPWKGEKREKICLHIHWAISIKLRIPLHSPLNQTEILTTNLKHKILPSDPWDLLGK